MRTARQDGVRVLLVVCAVTAWPDLAIARQPEAGLPANLDVDPMFQVVVEGMCQRSPAFRRQIARIGAARTVRVRVLPEDRPRPTAGVDARTAFTFDGATAGQCARLPSDDAAGTAIHRPRDGAHPRAARWHRSSGPGRKRRRLEEQRHDVRDPPGDRGRPAGGAGGRARRGSRHTTGRRGRVRCAPVRSCSENATRSPFPIEPDGSAQTAGSSRSSRRRAWSSAIGTTCATCMSSTVKPAGSRSRASAISGNPPTARAAPWTSAPTGAS